MAPRSIRYKSLSIRSPRFVGVGVGDDNDAAAFLQEAGITDYMQQRAIFELVSRLKGAGLWSKMKAIYPFIGGTASTHKWNLKDPRDVDAAFRLTFSGGWTHSATGIVGNATNAFAETNFALGDIATNSDGHVSIYIRTNNVANQSDWGGTNNSPDSYTYLLQYTQSIFVRDYRYCDPGSRLTRVNNPARTDGMFTVSANSSTETRGYRNDVHEATSNSVSAATVNDVKMVIGAARWNTSVITHSNREYAFFTAGSKLTAAEVATLYTIVDLYQKRLSRAV